MCGGGGTPEDNSDKVAQIDAQAARDAREAEAAKRAEEEKRYNQSLEAAFNNALQSGQTYFQNRGLDPKDYISEITQAAQRAKSTVPYLDAAPGTYFENLGAQVYDNAQSAQQGDYLRQISQFAPSGFESKRITNDIDDPYIESLLSERRSDADQYVQNLLDRGVITNSGFSAAQKNLEDQALQARARLDEIGLGLLYLSAR